MLLLGAVFMVGLNEISSASPPVPPLSMNPVISTSVYIDCRGDISETQVYTCTYVSDQLDGVDLANWLAGGGNPKPLSSVQPLYLAPAGRAAQIRYSEDYDAVGGINQLSRGFGAATSNLAASRDIAYIAGTDPLANAEGHEKVALSIVANGDAQGLGDMPSICPWAAGFELPATNEFIAAGSSFSTMVAMRTFTDTAVQLAVAPSLDYGISADGVGIVTAAMKLGLMEGNRAVVFDPVTGRPITALANGPGAGVPDLGAFNENGLPEMASIVSYRDSTVASGNILNFKKSMSYKSTIPAYQMPELWYNVP